MHNFDQGRSDRTHGSQKFQLSAEQLARIRKIALRLFSSLVEDCPRDREVTIRKIWRIGLALVNDPSIDQLKTLLESRDPALAISAGWTLLGLNTWIDQSREKIYKLLQKGTMSVLEQVAQFSLEAMESSDKTVKDKQTSIDYSAFIPELAEIRSAELGSLFFEAAQALIPGRIESTIGIGPVFTILGAKLIYGDQESQLYAKQRVLKFSDRAVYLVPEVIKFSQTASDTTQEICSYSLSTLAAASPKALAMLGSYIRDAKCNCDAANMAMQCFIEVGADAIPLLLQLVSQNDFLVQDYANEAILTIGQSGEIRLEHLSSHPTYRSLALKYLRLIREER